METPSLALGPVRTGVSPPHLPVSLLCSGLTLGPTSMKKQSRGTWAGGQAGPHGAAACALGGASGGLLGPCLTRLPARSPARTRDREGLLVGAGAGGRPRAGSHRPGGYIPT